jgi:phosphoglycolate phosphatase
MLKAVVFDLDGTLIDSTEAIIRSFFHTFKTVGVEPPSRQVVRDSISVPLETQFAQLTDGDPDELAKIYREHYFKTCNDGTVLLPGIEEAIRLLKERGLRTAIATSKSHEGSRIILEHFKIIDEFEFIIGADDVIHHKPDPEALLMSLSRLGIQSHEMVYVGDTKYDTRAAKSAGIDCVAVSTGYATREELEELAPRYVADTMLDAADFIIRTYTQ